MYPRATSVGVLAITALTLPASTPSRFDIQSKGAVRLVATGQDARYGVIPTAINGHPVISISLGANSAHGSLTLSVSGDLIPPAGRYPVTSGWDPNEPAGTAFRASFIAGSVERPKGAFRGESGWVRITEKAPSHICGEFEIRARGFLSARPENEDEWVTVTGRFQAEGNQTILESLSIQ